MKIMDDKSIRSALVPTPQPAAGWDVRLEARPADGGDWTEIFPAQLNWVVKQGHEVRATEVRREAPAPAEGVRKYGTDVIDNLSKTKLTCRELARYIWDRAQNEPMFFEQDIARLIENERRAAVERTRPDTAEARLREAAWFTDAQLAEEIHKVTGCQVGSIRTANIIKWFRGKIAALSPPSGGDEAKGSEGAKLLPCPVCGGEAIHAIETLKRTIIKPDPSEPDRREIVARIIDPHSLDENAAPDRRGDALAKADAIRRLASGPEGGSPLTAASDGEVG